MKKPGLVIVHTDLLKEGVIVDFSDGTTCLYTAEELRTINPVWEPVVSEMEMPVRPISQKMRQTAHH